MHLTVITPIAPERAAYIRQAEDSVKRLREHMAVQWLVVWDGPASDEVLEADLELHTGARAGVSAARHLALPHVTSQLLTTLDADDELVVGGCVRALQVFDRQSGVGWIGFNQTFMDGAPTRHWKMQAAQWPAGELARSWTAPFVFHPNSVVYRSDLVRCAGGWPAIGCNEDLGLVLRVSELSPGLFDPAVLTKYRTWPRQEVAGKDYPRRKRRSFAVIEADINAVRSSVNRPPVAPPEEPGGAFGTLRPDPQPKH